MKTDIIVPTWNNLGLAKQAVKSIRDNTTAPYRLIVVDDGSEDGTAEWLVEQSDIYRVTHEENRGFTAALNSGLELATTAYVATVSNDVEVDNGWLKLLIGGLDSNPKIGAIGPLSTAKHQRQWEGYHRADSGVVTVDYFPAFFCTLFRREAIEEVGLLDEEMAVYGSDNDYCHRLRLAGWELATHCDVLVKHDHASITPAQERMRQESVLKLREKWPRGPF